MGLLSAFKMSCKQATYLHEKKKEGKITFTETIGLKIHLLYCSLCRMFFKQIDELEKHSHHMAATNNPANRLNDTAREKMKQALQQQINNGG